MVWSWWYGTQISAYWMVKPALGSPKIMSSRSWKLRESSHMRQTSAEKISNLRQRLLKKNSQFVSVRKSIFVWKRGNDICDWFSLFNFLVDFYRSEGFQRERTLELIASFPAETVLQFRSTPWRGCTMCRSLLLKSSSGILQHTAQFNFACG